MGSSLRTRVKESINGVPPSYLTALEKVQISAVFRKSDGDCVLDSGGVILLNFICKEVKIRSDVYIDTTKKLKVRIQRVRPALKMSKVLLQHDNARAYTSLKTREAISSFGWTTISHPPYSPDLAPSDFHLFGPLKESLRGRYFSNDEEVKTSVRKWLKAQPVEFYNEGICALVKMWEKAVRKAGDYIEK